MAFPNRQLNASTDPWSPRPEPILVRLVAKLVATAHEQRQTAAYQQRFLNSELDRSLANIKDARDKKLIAEDEARDLTESAIRGAIGEKRPTETSAIESNPIKGAIDRVPNATKGSVRVTRPEGTVEIRTGEAAGRDRLAVAVDPPVVGVAQ